MNINCFLRYIDNIFLIYTEGETKIGNFLTSLNMEDGCIKFDHEISTPFSALFDTLIYIDENKQLQTTLHTKPTARHYYQYSF